MSGATIRTLAECMGFASGQAVKEIGYKDDVDEELRDSVEELIGSDLLDADYGDIVDAVILWFREEDGDLANVLLEAIAGLGDQGLVMLLTPKSGRAGHVEPSDLGKGATTAGLTQTATAIAAKDWTAARLAAPRSER